METEGCEPLKLDFRVAFLDDAEEITALVVKATAFEEEPNIGDTVFRRSGIPRILADEVAANCTPGGGVKWAVLETPRPEEAMVAACRLWLPSEGDGSAIVDILAYETEEQRDQLLVRVETLVRSFNIESIIVEVAEWRTDMQIWLSHCGYQDNGGHEWPQSDKHMLSKHTMVLKFQKRLVTPVVDDVGAAAMSILSLNISDSNSSADTMQDLFRSGPGSVMEGLIEDLFAALYRDNNQIFDKI